MSDKTKILIFTCACLFSFAVGLFCGMVSGGTKTEYVYIPETAAAAEYSESAKMPLPAPPQYYYMKSQDGIIYVYSAGEAGDLALMLEIDYIDFRSLTENQRQKLESGISFSSMEDVAEFVQDLGT